MNLNQFAAAALLALATQMPLAANTGATMPAATEGPHHGGIGHVHAPCKHLRAGGFHLGFGTGQCIGLHVHQHEVHAELRADARAFEAEARPCAGEHCGLALEVVDHPVVSVG